MEFLFCKKSYQVVIFNIWATAFKTIATKSTEKPNSIIFKNTIIFTMMSNILNKCNTSKIFIKAK